MKEIRIHLKRFTSFALTVVMGLSLVPANVTAAIPQQVEITVHSGDDVHSFRTESAKETIIQEAEKLPSTFDLRHVGGTVSNDGKKSTITGGKNYVTQVKNQSPWPSCWSFGATAAAETSLLYELGMTNEEYKEKNGGKELNLSEKALAYFSYKSITKDDVCDEVPASQIGEGAQIDELEEIDKNTAFHAGGFAFNGTSLYSSGIGPKEESMEFPGEDDPYPYEYRGKQGITLYDIYKDDAKFAAEKERLRPSYFAAYPGKTEKDFDEYFENKRKSILSSGPNRQPYSAEDDWRIPADHQHRVDENVSILQSSHILPEPVIRDKNSLPLATDESAIAAIKKELNTGKAVTIAYHADQSTPGQALGENACINVTGDHPTWAHYTFDPNAYANHVVLIVGYDDDYSKDNFLNGSYTNPKTGETFDKNPGKDGAFICKNSWGSINDDTPGQHNYADWGYEGSGYFYLSYYDKTLDAPESFDFYTPSDTDYNMGLEYSINQYDFLPTTRVASITKDSPVSMANVFTANKDQRLTHVSTQAGSPNTLVIYEVYKLREGYKDPTDGTLMESVSFRCEYGGFQRIPLNNPDLLLKKGEQFSVVMTQMNAASNGLNYEMLINNSNELKLLFDQMTIIQLKGVINKGESFALDGGKWNDWKDFSLNIIDPVLRMQGVTDQVYDNFSIKAYSVPPIESVNLSKTNLTLGKGQSMQLFPLTIPYFDSPRAVIWKSSNESIVSVDDEGYIRALKKGTATIIATSADGTKKKAKCKVTVRDKKVTLVKKIKLKKENLTLAKGKKTTLKATVSPAKATDKRITWYSTDPKVATVSSSGTLTAKKAGNVIILAIAGDRVALCNITVTQPVTSIKLKPAKKTLRVKETLTFTPTIKPAKANNRELTWKSSNTKVAAVKNGLVTAKKKGTAIITATAKDGSGKKATCKITVK